MNFNERSIVINRQFISGLIFLICIIPISVFSQQTNPDTIVPIKQDPEKLLRKMKLGKIEDGFNFWQDDFSGHWAGIDFGFNAFLNTDYTGFYKDFMENDIFRSNSTYINLVQQSIGLQHNRNTLGLVTGLGLHLQSYRLSNNTTIERLPNDVIGPKNLVFSDNQKSKLSIVTIYIPLLVEFQIPIDHYENRIYFSGGIYGSYRLSSHTKIKYREERKQKLKTPDHFSLHDFKYGIMIRTGYRGINLFATYEPVPLFKKDLGPKLTPFSFGITLLQF